MAEKENKKRTSILIAICEKTRDKARQKHNAGTTEKPPNSIFLTMLRHTFHKQRIESAANREISMKQQMKLAIRHMDIYTQNKKELCKNDTEEATIARKERKVLNLKTLKQEPFCRIFL